MRNEDYVSHTLVLSPSFHSLFAFLVTLQNCGVVLRVLRSKEALVSHGKICKNDT